ncbi:MAG: hypothetical protein Fur0022_29520 [Anaerolineales bacterium]
MQAYKDKAPQNPGLIFDRFAPDWGRDSDKEAKKKGLQAVIASHEKTDTKLLSEWQARWKAVAAVAHAEPFTLKTDWRFVAGVGTKGPLETGFTFHRYGFPILPGSSVKGVARAFAISWYAEQMGKEDEINKLVEILSEEKEADFEKKFKQQFPEGNSEAGKNLRVIFGTTGMAGGAIFFDAIPAQNPQLELDLVNPHYPDYYRDSSGHTPPTDWQSPIPSYFLTVAPHQEFCFAVGWRGKFDEDAETNRNQAVNLLKHGLRQLGAGAKTSAGYGYFT